MCKESGNNYSIQRLGYSVEVSHRIPSKEEMYEYAQQGIRLVVSDVDSTLTDGHEGSICPDAAVMMQGVREAGLHVALVSNNTDERYIAGVANTLGVAPELTFTPRTLIDRKPAPAMVECAIDTAGVAKNEVLAVGDGVTDLVSFFAAGIRRNRIVLPHPEEVGGYPLRSELRTVVHHLGKTALPHLKKWGVLQ